MDADETPVPTMLTMGATPPQVSVTMRVATKPAQLLAYVVQRLRRVRFRVSQSGRWRCPWASRECFSQVMLPEYRGDLGPHLSQTPPGAIEPAANRWEGRQAAERASDVPRKALRAERPPRRTLGSRGRTRGEEPRVAARLEEPALAAQLGVHEGNGCLSAVPRGGAACRGCAGRDADPATRR